MAKIQTTRRWAPVILAAGFLPFSPVSGDEHVDFLYALRGDKDGDQTLLSTGAVARTADPTHRRLLTDRIYIPAGKLVRVMPFREGNTDWRQGSSAPKEWRLMVSEDGIWFYGFVKDFRPIPAGNRELFPREEMCLEIPDTRLAVHLDPQEPWQISTRSDGTLSLSLTQEQLTDAGDIDIDFDGRQVQVPADSFRSPDAAVWQGELVRLFEDKDSGDGQRWGFDRGCPAAGSQLTDYPGDDFGMKIVADYLGTNKIAVDERLRAVVRDKIRDSNQEVRVRYYGSTRTGEQYAWVQRTWCDVVRRATDRIATDLILVKRPQENVVTIDVTAATEVKELPNVYDPATRSYTGKLAVSCVAQFNAVVDAIEGAFREKLLNNTLSLAPFFASALAKHYGPASGWDDECRRDREMQ